MKTYVLPAVEIAERFQVWAEEFCEKRKLELPEKEKYIDIVCAMIDDELAGRMKWADPSEEADKVLVELFPWYDPTLAAVHNGEALSANFHDNVIDHAFLAVSHMLEDIVESSTWHVWFMGRIGRDVVIEKGEDFRVLDWTRRMESGEWTQDEYLQT